MATGGAALILALSSLFFIGCGGACSRGLLGDIFSPISESNSLLVENQTGKDDIQVEYQGPCTDGVQVLKQGGRIYQSCRGPAARLRLKVSATGRQEDAEGNALSIYEFTWIYDLPSNGTGLDLKVLLSPEGLRTREQADELRERLSRF